MRDRGSSVARAMLYFPPERRKWRVRFLKRPRSVRVVRVGSRRISVLSDVAVQKYNAGKVSRAGCDPGLRAGGPGKTKSTAKASHRAFSVPLSPPLA